MADKHLTDAEWRDRLSPEQYRILREGGTEPPFSGALNDEKRPGTFRCAACGEKLFEAGSKYDSGSGWPSFTAPAGADKIDERSDSSHGMERVEIRCSACGGHLGHVFPDGPGPTGLRYCVNSASLDFEPEGED
ncbi:peptide-methionine (R)-S-oxide reductase MsrB [Sphingomicrobium aestuariivivum]|uniref:peptide-methionine (R)-S-oxide reductase MsrB n=1 Tax=Sphingomicrobium aestuariivivum TaxID=1582356 RepID=UPI001FD68904|nr:peptide-methionine (R)-S-oxide reductase MsrB [Sphingomicrobium aestuariivivum]MCJ8191176.1 peptide-methionine (R)-S-oxide reductase MsrB [Sphingomicrobium aestuariivivum]